MKQFVKDYLTFNKRERNGVFVLILIILLMLIYLSISHLFILPEIVDFTKFEKEINQHQASIKKKHTVDYKKKKGDRRSNYKTERFAFNPNNLPADKWSRLGFSEKQIQSINNYQDAGGVFRSKEDLKKMYVISEKQYLSLESFIRIPVSPKEEEVKKLDSPLAEVVLLDLNTADSLQLITIKGIGPYFASQIVKRRNLLGGFTSKAQLLEIWKFDSLKLKDVRDNIIVDLIKVHTINVNKCSVQELKHPYLNWSTTKAICNYRSKHGNYKTISEIKNTDLVDDETYLKIAPYLTVK